MSCLVYRIVLSACMIANLFTVAAAQITFTGSVYVTNINGDGLADLVSVGSSFRMDVIGNFGGLVARDLNLDSRHDLAVAAIQQLGTGSEATHVLLNQNARTNCVPPGSATLAVRICTPAANAGSARPSRSKPPEIRLQE